MKYQILLQEINSEKYYFVYWDSNNFSYTPTRLSPIYFNSITELMKGIGNIETLSNCYITKSPAEQTKILYEFDSINGLKIEHPELFI